MLVPPLNLLTLAALTPPDFEVKVVDERIEEIPWEEEFDLVGITTLTADACRAYEIADRFKKRGIKVVLGGMHVSVLPEEALNHADSIVVGEAEGIWDKLLKDLKDGCLKKVYRNATFPDLSITPPQKLELLNPGYHYINLLQTTRGCPYNCAFCSVPCVFGHKIRTRPLAKVEEELRKFKGRAMYVVDDNLFAIPKYAEELMRLIKDHKKIWLGQTSVNFLERHDKLLNLAREAGCQGWFVGFESIREETLKKIGKTHNLVKKYKEVIKKVHDYGMGIIGSFIFGFDEDDDSLFPRTLEFVKNSGIDLASFSLLTPLPGTRLFKEMEKEGRIITRDWSKYDCAHVVFKPRRITVEKLQEGLYWMYKEFYRLKEVMKRIFRGLRYIRLFLPLNLAYRIVGIKGYSDFRPGAKDVSRSTFKSSGN